MDGPAFYFPLPQIGQLVSDGHQFFEIPHPDFSLDVEMNLGSISSMETAPAPARPLPTHATTTSTTAAVSSTTPPGSPLLDIPEIVQPQPALSNEVARALIQAYILASVWFALHETEPCAGDTGVPGCALQLAKRKDSIWACFFERIRRNGTTVFKCVPCGHVADRLNRAVGHQRAKWEYKPFTCPDPGW